MQTAPSTFEMLWPETGASEDLPQLFGPPNTINPILIPSEKSVPPVAISPLPAVAPPSLAVPTPPQIPLPAPVKTVPLPPPLPVPSSPATSPFPPAPLPPPPTIYRAPPPVFPVRPQVDVKAAEKSATAQTQLPYKMSSVTLAAPPLPAPMATAMGGKVLKQSREMPTWLRIIGKGLRFMTVMGIIGGGGYGAMMWIRMNPGRFSLTTGWVIPIALLSIGLVFLSVGYVIHKTNEA